VAELRREYLWDFAHILHISPNQVDVLRMTDFAELILDIDAYKREIAKARKAGE